MVEVLTHQGFVVLHPAEVRAARLGPAHETIQERILTLFFRRYSVARKRSPGKMIEYGLSDAEVPALLGHPDLHRRCSELRACGLLTQDFRGASHSRVFNGVRGDLSMITPAGVAALRAAHEKRK